MFGLDDTIAEIGAGGGLLTLLIVATLLGLRHAGDPDHLAAVSVLVAGEGERPVRRATRLGLAWGAGHATTIIAFGIPIVIVDAYLPEALQIGTEALVGVLIMALSVRLLLRWRRSGMHAHRHDHGTGAHVHLHDHQVGAEHHHHDHTPRSSRTAYGIGLVHGAAGSAGIGVLLLAAIPDQGVGVLALLIFAGFTAVSMAATSTLLGHLIVRRPGRRRSPVLTPALGVLNFAFGAWYSLGALGALPYLL